MDSPDRRSPGTATNSSRAKTTKQQRHYIRIAIENGIAGAAVGFWLAWLVATWADHSFDSFTGQAPRSVTTAEVGHE